MYSRKRSPSELQQTTAQQGKAWQDRYLERYYSSQAGWVPPISHFLDLCIATIPPDARILEVGAGPARNDVTRCLATIGEVHGLDPDPRVLENDALDSAAVLSGDEYPYEAESFDAVVSNWVVEHVAEPVIHLQEVCRVLKPGAPYIFRTPNLRYPVFRIAKHTPHWFHRAVANRVRNMPDEAHDPWPTIYAMNSPAEIRKLSAFTGMTIDRLQLIEVQPIYGLGSRALFFPLMAYERAVNATEQLASSRSVMLAVLRRQ